MKYYIQAGYMLENDKVISADSSALHLLENTKLDAHR